jgi:hypothetical protein
LYTFSGRERVVVRAKIHRISVIVSLLLLCAFLTLPHASAAAASLSSKTENAVLVTEVAVEIGDNFVRYPQLEGMRNADIQRQINDAIVNEAHITQRLITLNSLQQGGAGLQVSQTAYLNDSLFSAVVSAKGIMENFRSGHQYTALAYDLRTGDRLRLDDFFIETATAVAWMEEQLLNVYADELSGHQEYAEITPLPVDSFSFDANGITFYYPYRQFSLLSGYSGAVHFQYGELQDFLAKGDDSVPTRLGIVLPQYGDVEILENIQAIVTRDTLPYLPVRLGDAIADLVAQYRLVRTPDQYPGGRYFQLEDPAFRQVLVMSDALTQGYDHSVAEGILTTRMNLYGIRTGVTLRSRWRQILGEPSASVQMDDSLAADYGLRTGVADYYAFSGRQLVLYADENDLLYAVRLTK